MQAEVTKMEAGEIEGYTQFLSEVTAEEEDDQTKKRPRVPMNPLKELAQNNHFQSCLLQGLHPAIWLSFDDGGEVMEKHVRVGPQRQQLIGEWSSMYELSENEMTTNDNNKHNPLPLDFLLIVVK